MLRQKLERFYQKYNPEKLKDIDNTVRLVAETQMSEKELFENLCSKYGVPYNPQEWGVSAPAPISTSVCGRGHVLGNAVTVTGGAPTEPPRTGMTVAEAKAKYGADWDKMSPDERRAVISGEPLPSSAPAPAPATRTPSSSTHSLPPQHHPAPVTHSSPAHAAKSKPTPRGGGEVEIVHRPGAGAVTGADPLADRRKKLETFYQRYNPSKMSEVDRILEFAEGISDTDLFENLCEKYNITLSEVFDELHIKKRSELDEPKVDFKAQLHNAQTRDEGDRVLRAEFASWISDTMKLNPPLTADNLFESLRNCVLLCELLPVLNPQLRCRYTKKPANHFQMLDNAVHFLRVCENELGILRSQLFEPEDLVSGRNLRQVLTCFIGVAKAAHVRFKVTPPQVVRFEMEIEEAEKKDIDEEELDRIIAEERRKEAEAEAARRREEEEEQRREEERQRRMKEEEEARKRREEEERMERERQRREEERKEQERLKALREEQERRAREAERARQMELEAARRRREAQDAREREEARRREEEARQASVIARRHAEDMQRRAEEARARLEAQRAREEELRRQEEYARIEREKAERARLERERLEREQRMNARRSTHAEDNPVFQYKDSRGTKYNALKRDHTDVKVGEVYNSLPSHCAAVKLFRVKEGTYAIDYPSRVVIFVRVLHDVVMVRVGGGFEPLEDFLRRRLREFPDGMRFTRNRHTVYFHRPAPRWA